MVFGGAKGLHALAVGAGGLIDILRHAGGADEAHRRNTRVSVQLLGIFIAAVHDVKHAVRQTGLFQQLCQTHGGRRRQRRRLEDEAVAAGQRQREHPHRHHRREVERGDPGHHAQRLHQRVAVDAGADVRGVFAFNQVRDPAGEFDHFHAAGQLAQRIRPHFAVLADDDPRQLFHVLLQQHFEVEQHAGAAQRRGTGPAVKRIASNLNRLRDFLRGRYRDFAHRFARRRIVHRHRFVAAADNGFPANKVSCDRHVLAS